MDAKKLATHVQELTQLPTQDLQITPLLIITHYVQDQFCIKEHVEVAGLILQYLLIVKDIVQKIMQQQLQQISFNSLQLL